MACVWRGLSDALNLKWKMRKWVAFLRENNCETPNVKHNGELLPPALLKQNKIDIANLQVKHMQHGYWCSTSDPVFFLVAQLFQVSIAHDYNGVEIRYDYTDQPPKTDSSESKSELKPAIFVNRRNKPINKKERKELKELARPSIRLASDIGHLWAI